jgi:hypothetical protein
MILPVNYNKISSSMRREVREEYIKLQNGICLYCGMPLNDEPSNIIKNKPIHEYLYPPNFFRYPVHLHHDHVTGMTKGAVHNYCNAVMWEYENE